MLKPNIIKSAFIITCVFIVFCFICGCNSKLPWDTSEYPIRIIYEKDDLVLAITESSKTGCKYELSNNTQNPLYFQELYYLQVLIDGVWNEIQIDIDAPAVQGSLLPGNTIKKNITWDSVYGTLPGGTYRLVIPFWTDEAVRGSIHYLAADFSV